MKVLQLQAKPLADGRIALTWSTPADVVGDIRILRRVRRFPEVADLGSELEIFRGLMPTGAPGHYVDGPLQGETVYYYAVITFDSSGRNFSEFVSAMARTPYRSAEHLYRNLPEIYRLFDQARTRDGQGPLLRLIELFGEPFDLIRSATAAMGAFHDIERVDGALLPLLANWIGLPSDTTLNFDRQRNEVRYAPQYYRTTGVPANLRAAVNRYTTWDARIKEFVDNLFLTTYPEQLRMQEMVREGAVWQPPDSVNLDVAYEGRVSSLRTADGRVWVFYHARRNAPAVSGASGPGSDEWHVYGKVEAQGTFLPSFRLTAGSNLHKHPSAVERPDGAVWLFYARYSPASTGRLVPHIGLQLIAAGRPALPARVTSTLRGPFSLADGDTFEVTINGSAIPRRITIRPEQFGSLAAVSATAVATLLNRELPGVDVTATAEGSIVLATQQTGTVASLNVAASPLAVKLGLTPGTVVGVDATAAQLTGTLAGPFVLAAGDTLVVKIDADLPRTLVFRSKQFVNIASATTTEVVAAINAQVPNIAEAAGAAVRLHSAEPGAHSVIAILVDASSAAAKLGFGAPVPSAPADVDEDEPAACVDAGGNVWLFWASRRDGSWKIWYSRWDGTAWGTPKFFVNIPTLPDREPFALFDSTAGGRLWVFWSRKKDNGLWNVISRTTTTLNFTTLVDSNWTERENLPAPLGFDNREPAATLAPTGEVELYFASNRADGWNIWTRLVTPVTQGAESAVTSGQVTRRAPVPLRVSLTRVRLFLRTNETVVYESSVYPTALTVDARYSGSTTVDLRNPTKMSLRGKLRDLTRYTYDVRRPDPTDTAPTSGLPTGLYARESVGVYLTPDTNDQALILHQRQLFTKALQRLVPIQVRLAFLVDQVYPETVYTYDEPDVTPQVLIGEQMIDTILPEVLPNASDAFRDRAAGVRFLRTWTPGETTTLSDLSVNPPNLGVRLFTTNFDEGV